MCLIIFANNFRGDQFSLVDSSFIPVLHRINITNNLLSDLELSEENLKKYNLWTESTLNLEAVKKSVPESFEADFKQYLTNKESFIHQR